MGYTNSSLVSYTKLSPNHSGTRTHAIDRISPHCVVGQMSVEGLGSWFCQTTEASSNYGIGKDGRIALIVEEKNRSWCTSSRDNDQRAVTIECASDASEPYAMTDAVYASLVKLCTDICRRNGKTKLLWINNKSTALNYTPASDEMIITVHRWFANKSCPGTWLFSRLGDLAAAVTLALGGSATSETTEKSNTQTGGYYRVRKSWADAKSQLGAYLVLDNAKLVVDKNPGYYVFSDTGVRVYPPENEYTVAKGDTLWSIAQKQLGSGSRFTEIQQLNGLSDSVIHTGQKLVLPQN